MADNHNPTYSNKCKSDPAPLGDWKGKKPLFTTIKPDCTFAGNEEVYARVCNWCREEHAPCAGNFTKCDNGCQKAVKGHDHTGHFSCDSIMSFIYAENTCVIQMTEAAEDDEKPKIDMITKTPAMPWDNNTAIYIGRNIESKCSSETKAIEFQRIPARFEYSCEDCIDKGSTGLLTRCCDICMDFHESLERGGIYKPFTVCKGCDTEEIYNENLLEGTLRFNNTKYKDHLADATRESMLAWIKEQPLSQYQETCKDPDTARRLGAGVNPDDPKRYCKEHLEKANELGAKLTSSVHATEEVEGLSSARPLEAWNLVWGALMVQVALS